MPSRLGVCGGSVSARRPNPLAADAAGHAGLKLISRVHGSVRAVSGGLASLGNRG